MGYANSRKAVSDHCKEKGVTKRDTLSKGGKQQATFINEPNLMRLIVKSKLPAAEKFEAWVFEEVLPTIRKTGKYEAPKVEPKIGSEEVNSVSARELYLDLGMDEKHWSRWQRRNIEENRFFSQGIDYIEITRRATPDIPNPPKDYAVTIEMAQHLAMMAKTQRAHDYRKCRHRHFSCVNPNKLYPYK